MVYFKSHVKALSLFCERRMIALEKDRYAFGTIAKIKSIITENAERDIPLMPETEFSLRKVINKRSVTVNGYDCVDLRSFL